MCQIYTNEKRVKDSVKNEGRKEEKNMQVFGSVSLQSNQRTPGIWSVSVGALFGRLFLKDSIVLPQL